MAKNYAVFFGGSGSMVAQAVVRLCECGYIQEAEGIKCLIVDADDQCGNKTDAIQLIGEYNKLYEMFKNRPQRKIFMTNLLPIDEKNPQGFFTAPNKTESGDFTLEGNIFGSADRASIDMMKFLFSDKVPEYDNNGIIYKEVYKKNLANGFFGIPAAGTMIFLDWLLSDDDKLIGKMLQDIGKDCESGDTRIFLIGSLFGGTGAAGLPVTAKFLRGLDTVKKKNNLRIGACLLLPYFDYETDGTSRPMDSSAHFDKAKMVLKTFNDGMKTNVLDRAYILGDSERIPRSSYSDEGAKQRNWPSVIELIAASALQDFFSSTTLPEITAEKRDTQWVGTGIRGDSTKDIVWDDFPNAAHFTPSLRYFETFNYMFSCGVVPLILKLLGNATGTVFETLPPKDVRPHDNMWIHHSFVHGNRLFPSRNYWYEKAVSTETVQMLFEYLTDSAEYFYKMSNEYRVNPLCSGCVKECKGGAKEIVGCIGITQMLKNLFNLQPLTIRANMMGYIDKRKARGSFKEICDIILNELHSDEITASPKLELDAFVAEVEMPKDDVLEEAANVLRLAESVYETARKAFDEARNN